MTTLPMRRRPLVLAGLLAATPLRAASKNDEAAAALRRGGVVLVLRHALAPGTFDPPGFVLADCATQRNLSDEGRAQAQRLGAWFGSRQLRPATVRSSPWCRCLDTARLAFGRADPWPALGSTLRGPAGARDAQQRQLREALAAATVADGRFEIWVTHMVVLGALAGENAGSGEGAVLAAPPSGPVQVRARFDAL